MPSDYEDFLFGRLNEVEEKGLSRAEAKKFVFKEQLSISPENAAFLRNFFDNL